MASIRVKIKETTNGPLDPSKRLFVIDPINGRLHGLQEDLGDNEYNLYIFLQNKNYRDLMKYESIVLKYFKSNKLNNLIFVSKDVLVASETSGYLDMNTSPITLYRPDEDAAYNIDADGNRTLRTDLITQAEYYELMLGNVIAGYEEVAVRRKYKL